MILCFRTVDVSQGRQLSAVNMNGTWYYYGYNDEGVRVYKNGGAYYHNYTVDGTRVIVDRWGDNILIYLYDADGSPIGMQYRNVGMIEDQFYTYWFEKNLQGDIVAIYNASGVKVITYTYDAWGLQTRTVLNSSGTNSYAQYNCLTYRGYFYDQETGLYYLNSRYYNPVTKRFLNADDPEIIDNDDNLLENNLFAYCLNNPINRTDESGYWSLPNWAKITIGAVATTAAVVLTVATGGAAAPVLIGVVASTVACATTNAVSHRVNTGSWEGAGKAAVDGAVDGFMWGGVSALGSAAIGGTVRTIKNAKAGITIGKMGEFESVAEIAKTRHYDGLSEFKFIEKICGTKTAETIGWWQNKCVVKGVMALKGAIYDCGGELTGAYAKEVALTKGYKYLYNIWLM